MNSSIKDQLLSHLLHEGSHCPGAILISGNWGVGKTYFLTKEILPNLEEKRPIYLSLFGPNSIQELKTSFVAKLVSSGIADLSSTSKYFEITESLLKSAPRLAGGLVKSAVKKYIGDDASAILELVDLKFDSFDLVPQNLIVCLDDLERKSISDEDLLGFINFLIDQKNCRVVLLANEVKIGSRFKEFKEKVVWLTLSYSTPLTGVYESFVFNLCTERCHQRLLSLKDLVTGFFHSANHSNLRTLQKGIRFIELLEDRLNAPIHADHIRFLLALLIEDAERGELHTDISVYNGSKHFVATFGNKTKPHELAGADKLSYDFYTRYFEGKFNTGFSETIYHMVRSGAVVEEHLIREFRSDSLKDELTKLLSRAKSGEWMFYSDAQVEILIEEIVSELNGELDVHIGIVFGLLLQLDRLCSHIDIARPDVTASVTRRINERAPKKDDFDLNDRWVENQREVALLKPLHEEYQRALAGALAERIKSEIVMAVDEGREINLSDVEIRRSETAFSIISDSAVLDKIDTIFLSSPKAHFRFYQYVIKRASEQSRPTEEFLSEIKLRLANLKSKSVEKSAMRRIEWLEKYIDSPR